MTPDLTLNDAERASKPYGELMCMLHGVATLRSIEQLLGWDQETGMPPEGTAARAAHMATISTIAHERATDERLGDLLGACESDAALTGDPLVGANLREIRRDYDRARKLSTELVAELASVTATATDVWKSARVNDDFAMFKPWLERVYALSRRKAECYGAPKGGELYDALLEDYEPGTTSKDVEAIFAPLREGLVPLIQEIASSSRQPRRTASSIRASLDRQKAFNEFIAASVGFDFRAGRLEESVHPFSSGIAFGDTRMTTRYKDDHIAEAMLTTLHETGHSLYEQNLPKGARFGQPLADAVGLGIHESQSRLWENMVGRSREFWAWAQPASKETLGDAWASTSPDELFESVNVVAPSLIRVEADEATYCLHIMLRFDLERAILSGSVAIDEIPAWWRTRFKSDFGLDVPNDRLGCLQDVHWSAGLIGYFPTYALGTLHAAQQWAAIGAQIPDVSSRISRGEFAPILGWLVENVHRHGRRYRAGELCERITGASLSPAPYLRYLRNKLAPVYGI